MTKFQSPNLEWQSRYARLQAAYASEFERNRQLHGDRIRCCRGCDDCCHQLFQISEPEAAEISRAVKELPPEVQAKVRERAATYLDRRAALVARTGQVESWGALHGEGLRLPCPALQDGACLVYARRPLICRKFGIPLWNPDRPGRVYACQLNFRDGEEIADSRLVQIQTELHGQWKRLQHDYSVAGGHRDNRPLTVARAVVEDCSSWFP
ncbi:MAG: YkgJ family cysteine cluster protein [Bryobacterales bacterium]|nr:YkgJ family cysteine cluster protein [Bryobacterales bacterium]